MDRELPFKETMRYPELVSIRVDKETKKVFQHLKNCGVDVGKLSRSALKEILEGALKSLDDKLSAS